MTDRLAELISRTQAAAAVAPHDDAAAEQRRRAQARRDRILDLDLPISAADEALLARDELRLDVGQSLPAVQRWLQDSHRTPWLWLGGPTGRGKTIAAAWAILARGTGRLIPARELERLHMTRFGDATVQAYERVCRDRCLIVIDDLGREDDAGRMQSALLDLADQRRGSGHLTICTSNLGRDTIHKRYPDARLWSRLDPASEWVRDVGPDLRLGGAS